MGGGVGVDGGDDGEADGVLSEMWVIGGCDAGGVGDGDACVTGVD